jgi:hypothetical protein
MNFDEVSVLQYRDVVGQQRLLLLLALLAHERERLHSKQVLLVCHANMLLMLSFCLLGQQLNQTQEEQRHKMLATGLYLWCPRLLATCLDQLRYRCTVQLQAQQGLEGQRSRQGGSRCCLLHRLSRQQRHQL